MSTTLDDLSHRTVAVPDVFTRPKSVNSEPAEPTVQDGLFSAAELSRFEADDAEAGRNICAIMTTLFTISIVLVSSVVLWTVFRAV